MQTPPTERPRLVPGLDMELDDAIDTPAMVDKIASDTLPREISSTIHCTEALVTYLEELHGNRRLDQFLTRAERAQVAQFIASLGDNPARTDEFFSSSSELGYEQRSPSSGWYAGDLAGCREIAKAHHNDSALPEYARESLTLLLALHEYLDDLHGNSDTREILTSAERAQVAGLVSQILGHPPTAD
ncbi:hypothetical protein [Kribbella sp. VKM Ac-2566]|uniref:hypothetical protein n=1 Tax=Kribbella sp. VKM Ac-2566 TaxID=2512218 RepID=UPI001063569E|nr:hypothetical protein [Kribbella sp. VKM Ac-2566]TDW91124.1 hypothetical protein EV647_4695 [Kribbella sp. VKM Ac-2566]